MSKESSVEKIKRESRGLRGTLAAGLLDEITGSVSEGDQSVIKHHGIYQQDDRDVREERAASKLERLYSFMIRLRIPGGLITGEQWMGIHHVAGKFSTGVVKITTRQTIQLHGIFKNKLKPTIAAFDRAGLDSIAACGDVNRNVIAAAHPSLSRIHAEVHSFAKKISEFLLPKTRAYYEIWLDETPLLDAPVEEDDLYKDTYLPRKFKIAIAIPPNNDVDVYANDIGLIAIVEENKLIGFNLAVGGGLSSTHGNASTYPRLASVIGFVCAESDILKAVYEVLTIQRDYGNRSDRKQARLKYTIDKYGLDWFREELEKRCGQPLEAAREVIWHDRRDLFGWHQSDDGLWHYTVFVENGRIADEGELKLKTALYEVARTGKTRFRFTANQNVILSDIRPENKEEIDRILLYFEIRRHVERTSYLRRHSMACVALPTCPLALAEGQRYLPSLITEIEKLATHHGLQDEEIIIRMTGCPNGCGRSTLGEIGFIGTGPGLYNMHIGADFAGTRLNRLYRENLNEPAILETMNDLFQRFVSERRLDEQFGDFTHRALFIA